MTTVAHGPYEHVGAYAGLAESEVFDTSGADPLFCELCEHSPCVAGGYKYCRMDPRFITAEHYARTTFAMADKAPRSSLSTPLEIAVNALARTAWTRDFAGDQAMRSLVKIRSTLRKAVRS